ncbi:MAG: glycosyltransferase family 39 protein [Elusimicrobiota bacterium]
MDRFLTRRITIIFVSVLSVFRGLLAAKLQLHPDEAYYWLWSRYLDTGYYDHPPMVAYFIRLTTLFSQAEFWVRFSGLAGAVIMSVLLCTLVQRMFNNEKISAASVMVFNALPLTMSGTLIMTPDIPAFFFWALAIFFYWELVRTQQPRYWYFTGIAFGLALLSKYTAVLFAPCLLLFVAMSDERRWLKTIHPYASFLLGCLFFLPVVYWNSQHQWISFSFQIGHGLAGKAMSLGNVLEYCGGHALVAGPFVWLFGMIAAVVFFFRNDKAALYLSCMSLPLILFFAATSLKKVAGPNWPAFAYFTFSILVSKYLIEGKRAARFAWGMAVAVNLLLTGVVLLHAGYSILPLSRWNKDWAQADATNFFYGWRELGSFIEKHPELKFAITLSHQYSPEITYYTHEKVFGWVDRDRTRVSQFNYWKFPDALRGEQGVYVYLEDDGVGPYTTYFNSVGEKISLTIMRNNFRLRKYQLIPGRGFALHDRAEGVPERP